MTVQIEFRGVLLFVTTNGTLDRILIPSAGKDDEPNGGAKGNHADTSKARPHIAGFMITKGPNSSPIKLAGGAALTVTSAQGGPCRVQNFGRVLSLKGMCNRDDAKDLKLLDRSNPGGGIFGGLFGGGRKKK